MGNVSWCILLSQGMRVVEPTGVWEQADYSLDTKHPHTLLARVYSKVLYIDVDSPWRWSSLRRGRRWGKRSHHSVPSVTPLGRSTAGQGWVFPSCACYCWWSLRSAGGPPWSCSFALASGPRCEDGSWVTIIEEMKEKSSDYFALWYGTGPPRSYLIQ